MSLSELNPSELNPSELVSLKAHEVRALGTDFTVVISGLWVWVKGNTKPYKEELKALGFHWSKSKESWYFAGKPCGGRGRTPMPRIAARYGYQEVKA